MAINIYDRRTMLAAVASITSANTFLKDTFFPNTKPFFTEAVDVDYKKGRRKMAPFVSPRIAGKVMERQGFTTKSFKPASIKPMRPITGDDLNGRLMGESVYSSKKPDEYAMELLAEDLLELDTAISRREEWMVAQVLFTGQVHIVGEGVDQVMDYEFTNKETLSGTDLFSNEASDPIATLKRYRLQVLQKSGITPDRVIMASDVVDAFINHPKVQKLMDITRLTLGKIDPTVLENGVTYLGSISSLGLDIYSYDEWYFDEDTQSEKSMVPSGTLMVGSTRVKSTIAYGAVTLADSKTEKLVTYAGERIPDSWIQKDPAARFLQIHSKPLPIPNEVDSWFVAKVL